MPRLQVKIGSPRDLEALFFYLSFSFSCASFREITTSLSLPLSSPCLRTAHAAGAQRCVCLRQVEFNQLTWSPRTFAILPTQPVFLNVYDLNPQNDMLFPMGLGAFHSVR